MHWRYYSVALRHRNNLIMEISNPCLFLETTPVLFQSSPHSAALCIQGNIQSLLKVRATLMMFRKLIWSLLLFADEPKITLAPVNRRAVENAVVSFFCKATGNPSPDVHWRKNGRRINANRQRYMVIEMPHGAVLRIEPVKSRRDDTTFECVADNGIGEPAIATASLLTYAEGESK